MADYVLSAKGTYDGSNFDGGVEASKSKLDSFTEKADQVGARVRSAIGSGFAKAADTVTSGIGTIGAAVTGLAAVGGINRALNIEQAQFKLKQMGLDVEAVMASCNEAVQGTAYGLDAAATVASSLGASGVQAGDQMTQALKGVAGMAAMSGRSMEDVGLIFGKVAATGKLQGDELNQMAEAGVNATASLAKYLGKTQAEVRKMVSAGQIDFQTFSDAMYATFGTAASGANETFSGAMSNVRAALSRTGEQFASPALDALRQVFVALIPVIDSAATALQPVAASFGEFLQGAVPKMVSGLEGMKSAIDGLGDGGFTNLSGGAKLAAAAVTLFSVGSLGGLISQIPIVGGALGGLFGKLGMLSTPFSTLGGLIGGARGAMSGFSSAVTAAGGGLTGFKAVMGGLATPANIAMVAIGALMAAFVYLMATNDQFRESMMQVAGQLMTTLAPVLQQLGSVLLPAIGSVITAFLPLLQTVIEVVAQLLVAIAPVVATIAGTVIPLAAQVLTLVAQIVAQALEAVMPMVQQVSALIASAMPYIQQLVTAAMTAIQAVIEIVWPVIQQVVTAVMSAVQAVIETVWPIIQQVVTDVMSAVQAVIETVWPIIQQVMTSAMSAVQEVTETVWPIIQSVIETVMGVIQGIITTVTGLISGDWSQVWDGISQVASSVWGGIKDIVSGAVGAVSGFVSDLVSSVTGFFGDLWSDITSTASSMWGDVTSAFSEGVSGAISFVSDLPGQVMGIFSDAGSWLLDSGESIIQGLVDGIQGAIGWATSMVSDAVGAIRNLFPFSPAKEGPFSGKGWVYYSGVSIMDALGDGAQSKVSETVKAYAGIASKVSDALDINPNVSDLTATSRMEVDYGSGARAKAGTYESIDNRSRSVTFNVTVEGAGRGSEEIAQDLYSLFKRNERGYAF